MHQVDELREALDREFPSYSERAGDWEGVLARTIPAESKHRRRRSPLLALAAAVAAAAVAVLFWPGDESSARILERARTVATDDPVVHLVLGAGSDDPNMTEVDLKTGGRRRLQSRHEQWFDPERGVHDLHTIDGRVYRDVLYPAGNSPELERQFLGFASTYRKALESGRASVDGQGTVNGRDVYWIRFHVRYPSVGIPTYDAEHEVAVDAETFEPRIWRATNEIEELGVPETRTEFEIKLWKTLPAGSGDFSAAIDAAAIDRRFHGIQMVGRLRTLAEARSVLSPPPLWLGREFRGLPLAEVDEAVLENLRNAQVVRQIPAIRMCYAEPACTRGSSMITMSQTNEPNAWFGWDLVVEPAKDKMILVDYNRGVAEGFIRTHGVYVSMHASDDALLLEAAQALEPIPASAGNAGGG